jgi:hypothetical protein
LPQPTHTLIDTLSIIAPLFPTCPLIIFLVVYMKTQETFEKIGAALAYPLLHHIDGFILSSPKDGTGLTLPVHRAALVPPVVT